MNSFSDMNTYAKRVLIAAMVVSLVILGILFLAKAFKVLLLIFAATLLSIFFRGIARWLDHRTPWNMQWNLLVAVLGTLMIAGGGIWALSPSIAEQVSKLSQKVPQTIEETQKELEKKEWGKKVVNYIQRQDLLKQTQGQAQKFFSAVFGIFGVIGDLYVILFMGLLIMANPRPYVQGFIYLIPKSGRERTAEVIDTLDHALRNWLAGKLLSMLIVTIFTWIGLWIVGIPLSLVLGLTAGLFAFVPNFGPLAALGLGLIVAASQGASAMLWTAIIYQGVQFVESNFLTPYIQQRMISLPMAMVLIAQLVLGVFSGALGLILATPVFAVLMVSIKMLYVEDVLGDHSFKLEPQK